MTDDDPPGMIKTRKIVELSDVSDDDDDDANFVYLKTGAAKKTALRELQQKRNLLSQCEGQKRERPNDDGGSEGVEEVQVATSPAKQGESSSPKGSARALRSARKQRVAGRASPSAYKNAVVDEGELDEEDAALVAKARRQREEEAS